ncbi:hypothetical protein ACFE04_000028 [Oxalis oulophora]
MSQAQSAGRKAGKSRDTNGNFLQSPRFLINVENPKAEPEWRDSREKNGNFPAIELSFAHEHSLRNSNETPQAVSRRSFLECMSSQESDILGYLWIFEHNDESIQVRGSPPKKWSFDLLFIGSFLRLWARHVYFFSFDSSSSISIIWAGYAPSLGQRDFSQIERSRPLRKECQVVERR